MTALAHAGIGRSVLTASETACISLNHVIRRGMSSSINPVNTRRSFARSSATGAYTFQGGVQVHSCHTMLRGKKQ